LVGSDGGPSRFCILASIREIASLPYARAIFWGGGGGMVPRLSQSRVPTPGAPGPDIARRLADIGVAAKTELGKSPVVRSSYSHRSVGCARNFAPPL
jgi:hypothetical protein